MQVIVQPSKKQQLRLLRLSNFIATTRVNIWLSSIPGSRYTRVSGQNSFGDVPAKSDPATITTLAVLVSPIIGSQCLGQQRVSIWFFVIWVLSQFWACICSIRESHTLGLKKFLHGSTVLQVCYSDSSYAPAVFRWLCNQAWAPQLLKGSIFDRAEDRSFGNSGQFCRLQGLISREMCSMSL